MGTPIPLIRARLCELADEYGIDELRELAEATKRNSPVRRAAKRRGAVTAAQRDRVKQFAAAKPHAPYQLIALQCDTDQGRVSEILNGKYDHLKHTEETAA